MSFIKNFVDGYNDLMINRRDPRVDGWLFMGSPFPTLIMCSCYIYFVKSLGPRLMRDRKPFELRGAIIVYNIIQVLASIYLVYKGLVHAWLFRYSLRCQPVDYSDDPDEVIVAQMCWWYYFCKFTEFLDTVFFVLRKKFDQITNLHVIHHSIMPAACWWGVKFAAGGHGTFFGMLNTFVHIIMYTYYLFSSMGPKYQKYLWWKKHLTTMQMVQFVMVFLHSAQLFFIDCNYPKILAYAMCFNALMFLSLFSNFYIQAYIKRRRLPAIKKEDDAKAAVTNGKANVANGKTNDKEGRGVGKMISNIMSNTTNACYIGQNGLYQSNSKDKSNGTSKTQKKNL
ncbi:elongation of very long chain fatty acids protein 7-like [Daphnia carinata]|uniref:elongation of very long chain fatty acids protein 7-like n=1 Tax=Daphnia carinata TaxID=120202 RepID=UPI0025808AC3|nr:elongation of very long chain fatty acids protein 7-like [Daphnia carinata]